MKRVKKCSYVGRLNKQEQKAETIEWDAIEISEMKGKNADLSELKSGIYHQGTPTIRTNGVGSTKMGNRNQIVLLHHLLK